MIKRKKLSVILLGAILALGVGAGLAPQTAVKSNAATTYAKLTDLSTVTSSKRYALGIDGTGFHYSGTSSWGLVSKTEAPYEYELTVVDASEKTFTAKTIISSKTQYLTVPTSNNFGMSTTSSTLRLGSNTYSTDLGTIKNSTTDARHIRLNGSSGLRSYGATTGTVAFFYEIERKEFGILDSISIQTPANIVSFEVGETFSRAGLVLTATDKVGEEKDITTGFTTDLDGVTFDNSYVGAQEVEISYTENDVTLKIHYEIVVLAAPVHQSTLKGMTWAGYTSGSVSADGIVTDSSTDGWRMSSSEFWGSKETMLGDYSSSANGNWSKFSGNNYYKTIASAIQSNTYGFAMYSQNFAVKGLLSAEFSWSGISSLGTSGNIYILGSATGGATWDILNQATLTSSSGNLSIVWSGSTYDVSDEVLVALAYTSSAANGQIRNVAMTLHGDSKVAARWAFNTLTIDGPAEMLVGASGSFTKNTAYGELPSSTSVAWSSSNTSVATIDSATGVITAVTAGQTTIKLTASDDYGTFAEKVVLVVATLPVLSSITAELANPAKQYYVEDVVTIDEIIVTAHYTESKSDATVSGATITGGATLVLGSNTLTISYEEGGVTETTTVAITAIPVPVVGDIVNGHNYLLTAKNDGGNYQILKAKNGASTSFAVKGSGSFTEAFSSAVTYTTEQGFTFTKTGTDKYTIKSGTNFLSANSDNNGLVLGSTSDSWTITAAEGYPGGVHIKDTNQNRYLTVYNSADFRTYSLTTGQALPASVIMLHDITALEEFASNFNTAIGEVCVIDKGEVKTDISALAAAWNEQATAFNSLLAREIAVFKDVNVEGNVTGTEIQKAISKYEYVAGKYSTQLHATDWDFMERSPAIISPSQNIFFNGLNDGNTVMLIVILSLVSVSVIGGAFYLRKREQN